MMTEMFFPFPSNVMLREKGGIIDKFRTVDWEKIEQELKAIKLFHRVTERWVEYIQD